MQLKNNQESEVALQLAVERYYMNAGNRECVNFTRSKNEDWDWYYLHFLVDRKHVIRYGIGNDPNPQGDRWRGGVELAIGPAYFGVADFWSYAASERFKHDADTDAVVFNLRLLDEFWNAAPR